MPELEINGKGVHVVELNSSGGDPVVMVHGLFTNLSVYYFGIASRLAKRHRVILYDLRSHGTSEVCDEGYTLEILSNDLCALMDAFGIEAAGLVGYSYGGSVALYTAARHPERIHNLALIEAPLLNEKGTKSIAENGADRDAVLSYIGEYSSSTHIKVSDRQAERVLAQHSRLHSGNLLANALLAGEKTMSLLAFDKLQIPTLLLYGRRSDLRHSGRALHSALPVSKYCLAWGDHNLPVQRGGWTGRQLERFFAKQNKAKQ